MAHWILSDFVGVIFLAIGSFVLGMGVQQTIDDRKSLGTREGQGS